MGAFCCRRRVRGPAEQFHDNSHETQAEALADDSPDAEAAGPSAAPMPAAALKAAPVATPTPLQAAAMAAAPTAGQAAALDLGQTAAPEGAPAAGAPAAAAALLQAEPAATPAASLASPQDDAPTVSAVAVLASAHTASTGTDMFSTAASITGPLSLSPGAVIESRASRTRYTAVRHLGSGRFGQVWLCREGAGGEARAVKLVPVEQAADMAAEVVRAKAATDSVGYYHVPRFYEASAAEVLGAARPELLLVATEYIDGASAGQLVRRAPLPEVVTRTLLRDVCIALGRLHKCGVVHCDVKDDNILISAQGQGYLCDFGVSVFLRDLRDPSAPLAVAGTPFYMAPELAAERPRYDEKVDVWSLGITAIKLACGRTPLQEHPRACLGPAQALRVLATMPEPELPQATGYCFLFREFLDRCVRRDPRQRGSVQDLLRTKYIRTAGQSRGAIQHFLERSRGAEETLEEEEREETFEEEREVQV